MARAELALEAAGARMRTARALGDGNLEVIFTFMDERFISVVNMHTLQVIDSGICLGHPPRDDLVTLESLPSVIKRGDRHGPPRHPAPCVRALRCDARCSSSSMARGGSSGAMPPPAPWPCPDSRARWEAIWGHRAQLAEIAHSHPVGPLAFSEEDETTMEALIQALGKRPRFSVVAPDGLLVRDHEGHESRAAEEPWWAQLLRLASGMRRGRWT